MVYAKRPFGGPAQALAYLGRYTHRVAIANSRLVAIEDDHVAFTWKDYRQDGAIKVMKLAPDEFIRRFLLHTLPDRFHRIRYFGFLANGLAPPSSRSAAHFSIVSGQRRTRRPTPVAGRSDAGRSRLSDCGGVCASSALSTQLQLFRRSLPFVRCDTS